METYGICLDAAMEGAYPAPFVAALCEQLPASCRWRVSYDRDAWWDGDRMLMASVLNTLTALVWGMSDKRRRGPRPRPVGPSWALRTGRKVPAIVMTKDELMRELAKARTQEVGGHGRAEH